MLSLGPQRQQCSTSQWQTGSRVAPASAILYRPFLAASSSSSAPAPSGASAVPASICAGRFSLQNLGQLPSLDLGQFVWDWTSRLHVDDDRMKKTQFLEHVPFEAAGACCRLNAGQLAAQNAVYSLSSKMRSMSGYAGFAARNSRSEILAHAPPKCVICPATQGLRREILAHAPPKCVICPATQGLRREILAHAPQKCALCPATQGLRREFLAHASEISLMHNHQAPTQHPHFIPAPRM